MPNDQSALDQIMKDLTTLFHLAQNNPEQHAKIMDHLRREITMLTELMKREGEKED